MFVAATLDKAAQERISEAAQFEKRLRMEAFLGTNTEIGCFKLRQFTCRDYCVLEYTENALLEENQENTDLDYVAFLWQLRTSDENRSERRFASWASKHLSDNLKREIECFLFVQFNDMPSIGGGSRGATEGIGDSSASIASIVDIIAHDYGWACDDIMRLPLQVVLQLAQRIFQRKLGDKYAISNRITQQARAKELNR